jgi:hypothetical protein
MSKATAIARPMTKSLATTVLADALELLRGLRHQLSTLPHSALARVVTDRLLTAMKASSFSKNLRPE